MEFLNPLQVAFVTKGSGKVFDDWADRMNHVLSVGLYILFTFVLGLRQYVGDPIQCWCPAQFTGNYIDYTNKICWVSNTYYVPMSDNIPKVSSMKPHLTYYQWTPFIISFFALTFIFPYIIWRSLCNRSGMYVGSIISAASVYSDASKVNDRDDLVKKISKHIERYVDMREKSSQALQNARCGGLRRFFNKVCCITGRRYGHYMIGLYLFCKALYCIVSLSQIFVLNGMLGQTFHMYGFYVLRSLSSGEDALETPFFPLVTLCDFYIREIGINHRYTVQCVLQVNLFNEKIFIFIWFWLVILTTINFISFVRWLTKSFFQKDRINFIKRNLKLDRPVSSASEKRIVAEFVNDYLRDDGVFTLRLVAANTTDLVVSDIVSSIYRDFKDDKHSLLRNGEKGTEM